MPTMIERRAQTFGLTMVDADEPLRFNVTKKDVEGANQKSPGNCAIARAVKRENPDVKAVFVFLSTAWVEDGERLVRYKLPPSAAKEVVAFDRAKKFEPGEYQLSPAPNPKRNKAQRAGKHPQIAQKKKAKARRAKGKPKRHVHRTENVRTNEF